MFYLSCRTFACRAFVKFTALLREETFLKRNPLRKTQRRLFNAEHTCLESDALPIVHHVKYISDLPENHRFPMGKFPKVLECLLRDQVITDKQVWAPKIASKELLGCVHTEEYLANFIGGKISEKDQRRTGFPWSAGLVQRCRYETEAASSFHSCHIVLFSCLFKAVIVYFSYLRCGPGGTVLAGEISLQKGLACSTAGGTHHAFPGYSSGFCLLNDLAVAARHLMGDSTSRKKILIVDLDVHQGDGTALIFKEEPDVFTFSMHCGKNFPLQKQKSDLDISVEDGTEDKEYLSKVQEHLPWLLDTFHPDLVLYDAGVDPHREDELGRLRLTDQGLYQRDLYVLQTVIKKGIPVATVIGGGYSRDIDRLAQRHSIIHRAASKVWREYGL